MGNITRGKIVEYDLTRIFAVILVVIGHCTYYTISTKYGGIDYYGIMTEVNINDTFVHKVLVAMVNIIYSFHMPLFVALSGALFSIQFRKNKYPKLSNLIKDKFFRLIVPFFIVTLCYAVPLKLFSNYFSSNLLDAIKQIFLGQILLMGNSSLWYLSSLFLDFILIFIVEKNYKGGKGEKIIFFILLHLVSYLIPFQIISNPLKYAFWFYMGYNFEEIRVDFNSFIKNKKLICFFSIGAFLVTYILSRKIPTANIALLGIKIMFNLITTFLGCFIVYSFAYLLTINTKIMSSKVMQTILNNSFGIYLYSDSLNYLILSLIYNILGIGVFGIEFGSLMIFLVRVIVTTVISIVISQLLKKNNVKYIC